MKLKTSILLILLSATVAVGHAQSVNWLTWEEAIEKSQTDKKKFFVDVYTSWCNWCKKMDETTFQSEEVVDYLNQNYHAIKFDAEQRQDITIGNQTYKFVRSGKRGYHELAFEIANGRLSYPTVVFLDENMKVIQSLGGYWGEDRFMTMLSFFAENHYRTTPWHIYQRQMRESDAQLIPVSNGGEK